MNQSPRVSLVLTPHKGIRNFMSQISLQAGNMDYTDRRQVEELKRFFDEISLLLEEHAATENNYILPALEARVPGGAAHDEAEHEELHQLQEELSEKLRQLLAPGLPAQEAHQLGHDFYLGLSRLHAEHLEHMQEEETITQGLMWEHFTDEELMQIHRQVISSIPPDVMLIWMKYILPALTAAERSQLLAGLQAGAPAPFFQQVMQVAESVLTDKQFTQLRQGLSMEETVA